jgi:hypothetical protein
MDKILNRLYKDTIKEIDNQNLNIFEENIGLMFELLWAMVPGTIKRQKGLFVHVESTTNFIERESQMHMLLRLPFFN